MTIKENIRKAVKFERPDYIPLKFHINESCWNHYDKDFLLELVERHPLLFPDFEAVVKSSNQEIPIYAKAGVPFTDPWGCVWKTSEDGITGAVIQHPLPSWENLDNYIAPDPNTYNHWGKADWQNNNTGNETAVTNNNFNAGEIGHNHTWLKLTDIRGYENTIIDMAMGDPNVDKLLEILESFNMGLLKNFIHKLGADWITFAEDLGMQSGPMMSPEQFKTYIKPSYQRLFGYARENNCIVHVHSDGHLHHLIDDLLDCKIDVLNLQDIVNGIEWIKCTLKGKLCLELDIDRQNITVQGSPRQIDDLIRKEVEELGSKEGGLMFIYGLYPQMKPENIKAVMDAMERYADYY